MSRILTAAEICERSLRAIGAFPLTESAADAEYLREAMFWLDLVMAQKAGTGELFFLVSEALPIEITNGTSQYDLNQALGSNLPADRLQFPLEAWLEDAAGNRTPLTIAKRQTFQAVCNDGTTGAPTMIYIDRLPTTPKMQIYPTPATSDPQAYTIMLVVQTYAPNVAPAGVTGTKPDASILTKFRQAWQRWLILKLNIDLAGGPIRKLPQTSIDNWKREAEAAEEALEAFENQEHDTEEPVCEAWG
jgi:hypothetical protein